MGASLYKNPERWVPMLLCLASALRYLQAKPVALSTQPSPANVHGSVEFSGTSFTVQDMHWDAMPKDAAWWAAKVSDLYTDGVLDTSSEGIRQGLLHGGRYIGALDKTQTSSPKGFTVRLENGQEVADYDVIALWSASLRTLMAYVWVPEELQNAALARGPQQSRHLLMAPMVAPAMAPDGASSRQAFVGASFPFIGLAAPDGVKNGLITITGPRSFQYSNLTFGGQAPGVFWRGALVNEPAVFTGTLESDAANMAIHVALLNGTRLNDKQYNASLSNASGEVQLPANITWDQINVISFYCEDVMADLAHALLPPVASRQGPGPLLSHAYLPTIETGEVRYYDNCLELWNGTYHFMWKINGTKIHGAMMAEMPAAQNMWLGFGFSDPSLGSTNMVGGDVVVGGLVGSGGCFAYDYYLGARSQCNYATGKGPGVCPDALLGSTRADNNVQLVSCTMDNGVLTIEFTRPLAAMDEFDHDWPVGKAGYAIWAIGPLSESSTPDQPVVLFHRELPKGPAQTTDDLLVDLGKPSTCSSPLLASVALGPVMGPAPAAPRPTIQGVTEFTVILGNNPNYPNPPGWGVAYHVNDIETPVLIVERCKTYTFSVQAGGPHPLYITTSRIGGHATTESEADAAVFAGGEDSYGSAKKPYILTWTPAGDTPDVVYYQCYEHQKLGWMIKVSGTGTCTGSPAGAPAAAAAAGSAPAPSSVSSLSVRN